MMAETTITTTRLAVFMTDDVTGPTSAVNYVCMYVCMYVCIYIYIYMTIYIIHVHTLTCVCVCVYLYSQRPCIRKTNANAHEQECGIHAWSVAVDVVARAYAR
jgi:hypothetical protein